MHTYIHVCTYVHVYVCTVLVFLQVVAPKKAKLAEAEAALAVQMEKLNTKRAELQAVGSR